MTVWRVLVEAVRLAREVGGLIGIIRDSRTEDTSAAYRGQAAGRAAHEAAKNAGPRKP